MKQTTFVVPPETRRLLGQAPVLSSEDPDRFEEMLNYFAQCYQPKNAEWFGVWNQTAAAWKLQRLTRYENQVQESMHKKLVEEGQQARAKQAEEERKNRELPRMLASWEPRPAPLGLADEKSAGINTRPPSDISILSGLALRQAKERLLSRLLAERNFA